MIPQHFQFVYKNDTPLSSYTNEILEIFKSDLSSDTDGLIFASVKNQEINVLFKQNSTITDVDGLLFVYETKFEERTPVM